MTNQQILDQIDEGLPELSTELREKILDAVWEVLSSNREDSQESNHE